MSIDFNFHQGLGMRVGLGIFFALTGFLLGCSDPSARSGFSQAPDFRAEVFSPRSSPPLQLAKINAQQPVLLVFWATWCPSCLEEIPKLNRLAREKNGQLQIISVNAQEEAAQVQKFLTENPVDYTVVLDEEALISDLFGVTAIPSVLFLAKGGKILYYGFQLPSHQELEAWLHQ